MPENILISFIIFNKILLLRVRSIQQRATKETTLRMRYWRATAIFIALSLCGLCQGVKQQALSFCNIQSSSM